MTKPMSPGQLRRLMAGKPTGKAPIPLYRDERIARMALLRLEPFFVELQRRRDASGRE